MVVANTFLDPVGSNELVVIWTRRNVGMIVPQSTTPQTLSVRFAVPCSELTVPKRQCVLIAPLDWKQSNFLDQPTVKERMFAMIKAAVFKRSDPTFKLVPNDVISSYMITVSFPATKFPDVNREFIHLDCLTACELMPREFGRHMYPVENGRISVPRACFIRFMLGRFERHIATIARRYLTEEAKRQLNGKRRPSRASSEAYTEPPCFRAFLTTCKAQRLHHENRFQLAQFVNSFPDEPILDTAKEVLGDSATEQQFSETAKFTKTRLPRCVHMGTRCPGMCHSLGEDATPVDVAYSSIRGPKRSLSSITEDDESASP